MNKQKDIKENFKEINHVKDLISISKVDLADIRFKKREYNCYLKNSKHYIFAPPEFTEEDEERLTKIEDHIKKLEDFLTDLEEYYWVIEAKDDY
jgi:hypothetical protein